MKLEICVGLRTLGHTGPSRARTAKKEEVPRSNPPPDQIEEETRKQTKQP
jgi:hypothetical protein